jgi:hypothetical protein
MTEHDREPEQGEQPGQEETIRDLELPDDQMEDVKGGHLKETFEK